MLGKKNSDGFNTGGNLNTIIGKGSAFEGTLSVESTLRVDGRVKGTISATDSLVIGKHGDVDGDVTVNNAIIGGKLAGKLTAKGKVVLESNSMFRGELKTSKLVIDEGAIFHGKCSMDGVEKMPKHEMPRPMTELLQKEGEDKGIKLTK